MSILINGTCKDCAHWSAYRTLAESDSETVGRGQCRSDRMDSPRRSGVRGDDLVTGPDFGCIHWKEKT